MEVCNNIRKIYSSIIKGDLKLLCLLAEISGILTGLQVILWGNAKWGRF